VPGIALVKNGSVASNGGSGAAAPAFGQATGAGDLLVATVVATSGASGGNFTCSDGTWTRAVQDVGRTNVQSAVFYKANCGAGETAPTFSYSNAATVQAALWEFSGVAVSAPLDKVGSANGSGTASTVPDVIATTSGVDAASGELFVSVDAFSFSSGYVETSSDTYGNGATPTGNLNNDATGTQAHYRMAYGITTSNAAADQNEAVGNKLGSAAVASVSIASFKAQPFTAVAATDQGIGPVPVVWQALG
jgi:hypothetical protein